MKTTNAIARADAGAGKMCRCGSCDCIFDGRRDLDSMCQFCHAGDCTEQALSWRAQRHRMGARGIAWSFHQPGAPCDCNDCMGLIDWWAKFEGIPRPDLYPDAYKVGA